jgi:lipopolysaccharide export LptBFGC system permease protein LptF
MLLQAVQQATLPRSSKSFLFNDYDKQHQLRKLIYIRQFKGKDLKDCTILDFSEAGTRKIIQAKSGTWSPEVWEFNNANAYILKDRGEGLVSNHSGTIRMTQLLKRDTGSAALKELDSPDDDQNKLSIHSETMTFATLFHRIGLREQAGLRVSRGTYMNLWDKLTLPLSCLVITLIAVPLAITHPRSSNRRGFVFSLAVLFSAYLLRSVFESLGQAKWFTLPGISKGWMLCGLSWLPLVILMILAMILLRKKSGVLA